MEEALLSVSPAGPGQLVKMLTTLELQACQHCLSAFFDGQGFVEHQSIQMRSVSENAQQLLNYRHVNIVYQPFWMDEALLSISQSR